MTQIVSKQQAVEIARSHISALAVMDEEFWGWAHVTDDPSRVIIFGKTRRDTRSGTSTFLGAMD